MGTGPHYPSMDGVDKVTIGLAQMGVYALFLITATPLAIIESFNRDRKKLRNPRKYSIEVD